jgi:glycosyltransferase involved in cell wall biosynthesis
VKVALANVTSGGLSGGYRKYLSRMAPRLRGHPRISALEIYVPEAARALVPDLEGAQYGPAGTSGWLRERLGRFRPDVLFIPTARRVGGVGMPTVVMVRNMEPLILPFSGNPISEGLRNVMRRWAAWRACRGADRIIAVSGFVRDFLVNRWGLPEAKVPIVYHGVEPPRPGPSAPAFAGELRRPFLFTAGSIRPGRGLEDLLGALAVLPEEARPWDLVVAGAVDPRQQSYRARLEKLVRGGHLQGRIVWAGPLKEPDMAWAFAQCRAFVMTTRTEACPNTALEAMAAGCVLVSTDAPPMPEFFGELPIYYRGGDPASLAEALRATDLVGPAKREEAGRAARARAAAFTWDATVARTVEELEIAAGTD